MKIEPLLTTMILVMAGSQVFAQEVELTYFGRSTVKLRTASGFVVYIDPYAPGDYSAPADLILVTHGHDDHNATSLVKNRKPGCTVIAPSGAVREAEYQRIAEGETMVVGELSIKACPAYNRNHPRGSGVGYLLKISGVKLYHAGDTSFIPELASLASEAIDLALFPADGRWNMAAEEALTCAEAVNARLCAAIHTSPDGIHDERRASRFSAANAIQLRPGAVTVVKAGQ